MTRQALTPFARKLAETMFTIKPEWWNTTRWRAQCDEAETHQETVERLVAKHGWTQKDHEAILDRPRVTEPWKA